MPNDREGKNRSTAEHPTLELLLNRAGGLLAAEDAARVDAHLARCAACRLEVKRLARFEALDADQETAAEAAWEAAVPRLDAVWDAAIRPALPGARRPGHRLPRWLGPLAAAAVIACVAFLVGVPGLRDQQPSGPDTMRGRPATTVITGTAPAGEIPDVPAFFAWAAEREFEAYVLEVFTENLETVLRLEDLPATRVDLPDSLRAVFLPDSTYFWHVEGREGLSATEASTSIWFRIVPPAD